MSYQRRIQELNSREYDLVDRVAAMHVAREADAVVAKLVDSLEQALAWLKVSGLSADMPVMQNSRSALDAARRTR